MDNKELDFNDSSMPVRLMSVSYIADVGFLPNDIFVEECSSLYHSLDIPSFRMILSDMNGNSGKHLYYMGDFDNIDSYGDLCGVRNVKSAVGSIAVRPSVILNKDAGFSKGDMFDFGGKSFIVLEDGCHTWCSGYIGTVGIENESNREVFAGEFKDVLSAWCEKAYYPLIKEKLQDYYSDDVCVSLFDSQSSRLAFSAACKYEQTHNSVYKHVMDIISVDGVYDADILREEMESADRIYDKLMGFSKKEEPVKENALSYAFSEKLFDSNVVHVDSDAVYVHDDDFGD